MCTKVRSSDILFKRYGFRDLSLQKHNMPHLHFLLQSVQQCRMAPSLIAAPDPNETVITDPPVAETSVAFSPYIKDPSQLQPSKETSSPSRISLHPNPVATEGEIQGTLFFSFD